MEIHVDKEDGFSVATKLQEAGLDAKEAEHYKKSRVSEAKRLEVGA